ncbi:MAG: phosphate acyltransferase [Gammaproteobacteria bacterium]
MNSNSPPTGYKIMQRAAGADAIGPILQGFSKPWLDLSRGASVDDILGVATIAASLSKPAEPE